MKFEDELYWLENRKKKAWRNIIIIIICMLAFAGFFCLSISLDDSRNKTKEKIAEFGEVVREHRNKNIPLKTNILSKCINGKKAIIVNEIIYYAGDVDTWGDIKGVDCE